MVLNSTFEHGWLLSKLLKLDDEYQGRWEQWQWTIAKLISLPIPK
ncbi:hypothetical protein [Nostoc sp. 'Peltigera membranacea cyanobiont' N6]|nr:hypothetical protein [Nostoc sp. 'Peltigera membranacea cyanobiont' N6]